MLEKRSPRRADAQPFWTSARAVSIIGLAAAGIVSASSGAVGQAPVTCVFGVFFLGSACINFALGVRLAAADRWARFARTAVAQRVLIGFAVAWWITILINAGAAEMFAGMGVAGASVIVFATLVIDPESRGEVLEAEAGD